jgi:hypothetical protein
MEPIIPKWRKEPFDHPEWTFELKYDGFRGLADTVNGRMLSKNGHLKRYDALVSGLPRRCVNCKRAREHDDAAMAAPKRPSCLPLTISRTHFTVA